MLQICLIQLKYFQLPLQPARCLSNHAIYPVKAISPAGAAGDLGDRRSPILNRFCSLISTERSRRHDSHLTHFLSSALRPPEPLPSCSANAPECRVLKI